MKKVIAIIASLTLIGVCGLAFAVDVTSKAIEPTSKSTNLETIVVDNGEDQPNALLAKIIDVEPIYVTRMVPHESCHMEPQAYMYPNQRAIPGSGTFVGGAAGGLIGSRFGGGNGNIAATIGGTVLGAMIGSNMENEMNRPYVVQGYVQVCHTRLVKESHVKGYNVTYLLNGKAKTTFMKKKPKTNYLRLEMAPVGES